MKCSWGAGLSGGSLNVQHREHVFCALSEIGHRTIRWFTELSSVHWWHTVCYCVWRLVVRICHWWCTAGKPNCPVHPRTVQHSNSPSDIILTRDRNNGSRAIKSSNPDPITNGLASIIHSATQPESGAQDIVTQERMRHNERIFLTKPENSS